MKAAIIQSNYIPWKGYFDIIHDVDTFVFLDDVQYTHRDWRNRNKIKTPNGLKWLSVPVIGGQDQLIKDVKINNSIPWNTKHKETIHHCYASAPYYHSYNTEIFDILLKKNDSLSDLNITLIKKISGMLDICVEFILSTDLKCDGNKDDKLINICHRIGADHYVSGPAAKSYIQQENFLKNNIELSYKDYSGYPEHPQLWGEFEHSVSIIDIIFNCGDKSSDFIWGWRND
jgi:hypothetical protein